MGAEGRLDAHSEPTPKKHKTTLPSVSRPQVFKTLVFGPQFLDLGFWPRFCDPHLSFPLILRGRAISSWFTSTKSKIKMKLYSFRFSPPARLAQMAASICDVNIDLIEVDLSKLEQFEPWYLAINQKHRVPVLEENGVYMDESLNIVKHFFNAYNNNNPENDHWYPQDPDKRKDVNEWLEWAGSGKGNWKTAIHLTIRTVVVMAHMAPQQGMNWRDHMGAIICLIGYKARKNQ